MVKKYLVMVAVLLGVLIGLLSLGCSTTVPTEASKFDDPDAEFSFEGYTHEPGGNHLGNVHVDAWRHYEGYSKLCGYCTSASNGYYRCYLNPHWNGEYHIVAYAPGYFWEGHVYYHGQEPPDPPNQWLDIYLQPAGQPGDN